MKKTTYFIAIIMMVMGVNAQTITVNKTYKLTDEHAYHPTFNEDGSQLVFSSSSYDGLSLYNFLDASITKITEDEGAGFDPVFSKDGKRVFYKNTVYVNRLRQEGVKSYSIATGNTVEMLKPERRSVSHIQSYHNGVVLLAENKIFKTTFGETNQVINNYVWSDGVDLNIIKNNKRIVLNPIEDANGYIWASMSPNGKMILFTAPASGTFVCDLNGKILYDLGYLNAPIWYDDKYVVGMIDRDDGHIVTESKIIMKSINGKTEQVISSPEHMAMFPTASAKAGKIAYNTDPGVIYIVELTIQ